MSDQSQLPAAVAQADLSTLLGAAVSPALQIILNDRLYDRCKDVATRMAQAEGVTPKHLVGKPAACFAVVQMALIWKLAPQMVAGSTYQTPNGNMGYEGKLCHAILENSGHIDGQIKAVYYGPWEKIVGKFKIEASRNQYGKDVKLPKQLWTDDDEEGVGVTVIAQVKGEVEPRTMDFDLKSAHPRNSTIWLTRTKQQLWYTAIRAFGNMAMPGIFMGVPFDAGDGDGYGAGMVDVTPAGQQPQSRPTRATRTAAKAAASTMDSAFKETVGPAAPAAAEPVETVIENEAAPANEPEQEPAAAEPEQRQAQPEPEQEQEIDDHAETHQQEEAGPQEPDQQAPAEGGQQTPPQGRQIVAMTEAEAKKFRTETEKAVMGCNSTIDMESLKQRIGPHYHRMKAFSPELAAKLMTAIRGKEAFLIEREERAG